MVVALHNRNAKKMWEQNFDEICLRRLFRSIFILAPSHFEILRLLTNARPVKYTWRALSRAARNEILKC